MMFRLGLFFLAFISFFSSACAQEVHLFLKSNGTYYAAPKSERVDTGIIVDEKLAVFLTDKQFKSIIEGKVVSLNKIPITTLNWNQWYTQQTYTERFSQEATLENSKIVIKDKQTAEEKEFLNLSLYLMAIFFLLLFFSSLFRDNNKVELHKFILGVAGILSVIIFLWSIVTILVTLPEMNGHIFKLIMSAVAFTSLAFIGVIKLQKNLSSKFARVFSVASMIVVGVCLFII